MFSRISCFLCALIVSSGVWVQDSISVVERSQGINVAAEKHSIKLELVDQKVTSWTGAVTTQRPARLAW